MSHSEAKIPRIGTPSASSYFESYANINNFSNWVMFMAAHIDRGRDIAHEALASGESEYAAKYREEHKDFESDVMLKTLKKNRQMFLELMLCRHIDNYLNYIIGLLSEIFLKKPEALRPSEPVDLELVLRHSSMKDFILFIAQRKVERLSYKSFKILQEFFEKRFKLHLFDPDETMIVVEAIETRNIATHNRCIINGRYCERTGAPSEMIGEIRSLVISDLDNIIPLLATGVARLDREARRKLKLKGTRFAKPESRKS